MCVVETGLSGEGAVVGSRGQALSPHSLYTMPNRLNFTLKMARAVGVVSFGQLSVFQE